MNPKKLYLADGGFVSLGRAFAPNRGRILENNVAVELMRRGEEKYYFKENRECDFVLKQGTKPTQAIQVCWELTNQNEKRELAGLTTACHSLGLSSGLILTNDQHQEMEKDGIRISARPVWRWLEDHPKPFLLTSEVSRIS
jgi:predicted AAA+ superfamily ATPase